MPKIPTLLQLFRWYNLLFLIVLLMLLRYCIITPFEAAGLESSLSHFQYALLVLSIVLVAAAGYAINDYFDLAADTVNRPDKLVVGYEIQAKTVLNIYWALTLLGIALGFGLGVKMGNYRLGFIHVFSASILWFYSNSLKRKPLIGNIFVAILAALSVISVALYEPQLAEVLRYKLKNGLRVAFEAITGVKTVETIEIFDNGELISLILSIIAAYALFAFLLTLVRELAKDMEDYEGDQQAGYHTAPIAWGFGIAKLLAAALVLITIKLIADFQINEWLRGQRVTVIGALLLLQLPLLYLVWQINRARVVPNDFRKISKWLKAVMLAGLLYLPYFRSSIQIPDFSMEIQDIQLEESGTPIIDFEPIEPNDSTGAEAELETPVINISADSFKAMMDTVLLNNGE